MTSNPCPDPPSHIVSCAVITVSDTRTAETDQSGNFIKQSLSNAGHLIQSYVIVKDEPDQICAYVQALAQEGKQDRKIDAIILNGGTGIAPRDTTFDAINALLEKTLPGFGEMFRYLSWQEVGSRAIASRAVAGIYCHKLIFSLPGSSNAVKLAINELILPEIIHLVRQIQGLH